MTQVVTPAFSDLVACVSPALVQLGFEAENHRQFKRAVDESIQRFSLSERAGTCAGSIYVEAFAGFNFERVEEMSSRLQGKQRRREIITCSLNIGLLDSGGSFLEWHLLELDKIHKTAELISEIVKRSCVSFWADFDDLDKLALRFDERDRRICRGSEWPWRCAATHSLLGEPQMALNFLRDQLANGVLRDAQAVNHAASLLRP